jgi:membrane protease YdiL (CAAX protease family)
VTATPVIAAAAPAATASRHLAGDVRGSASAVAGLAVVVWLRWAALVDGRVDGITIGLLFGLGLVAVGLAAGGRVAPVVGRREPERDAAVGVAGGTALIGLAVVARLAVASPLGSTAGLGPATLFAPWLGVTVLVALAEELVLRGVLFGALDRLGGAAVAVAVTSVTFALMHVPVYGWHVVPLDLGVGVFLGGLRLATGRWLASGIAHVVADVATWWL